MRRALERYAAGVLPRYRAPCRSWCCDRWRPSWDRTVHPRQPCRPRPWKGHVEIPIHWKSEGLMRQGHRLLLMNGWRPAILGAAGMGVVGCFIAERPPCPWDRDCRCCPCNDQNRRSWSKCYRNHRDWNCLLYTSDAADERSSVDLGGRRIINKKTKKKKENNKKK